MMRLTPTSRPAFNRLRESGVALVMVLSLLVIVLGLAVAFLGRVSVETRSSASFAAGASTRQLADVAVNQVIGQIRDATVSGDLWASQPGVVTTFGPRGSATKAHKLYSATNLVVDNPNAGDLDADVPPADWAAQPGAWTDLNAPVVANGTTTNFPLLDPAAAVDGFAVKNAPGATAIQPAPMPVRWLYVLRDGTLTAPASAAGTTVSWSSGGAAPSSNNPIVGRIAYWTDDETAKININTASEGSFWDTPRAGSDQERGFGLRQPVQREFQRYPGHPATTSLSPVFFPGAGELTVEQRNAIYQVVPRIVGGGSVSGTVPVNPSSGALTPDADRLYATVDEMIFAATNRAAQPPDAAITPQAVERARFFLTTASQAPEVNLFGLPRVAMWPVFRLDASGSPNATRTTAFDRLIAFNSTINGVPYFFQREIANSARNDWDNIQDNQRLYAYLSGLLQRNIPGFGGNFADKYPQDFRQILTLIFDYIRCTNLYDDNLSALANSGLQYTPGRTAAGGRNSLAGHGQVVPIEIEASPGNITRGFGRFPTLTELALQFIATADAAKETSNVKENTTLEGDGSGGRTLLTPNQRRIQLALLPEFFTPMEGWGALNPDFRLQIEGLGNLLINGQAMFTAPTTRTQRIFNPNADNLAYSYTAGGGNMGFHFALGRPTRSSTAYPFISGFLTVGNNTMDFSQTGDIVVRIQTQEATPRTVQTFNLRFAAPGEVVTLSVPTLAPGGAHLWGFNHGGNGLSPHGRLDLPEIPGNPRPVPHLKAVPIQSGDVVKSVLPQHGDLRLVAARRDLDMGVFLRHPNFLSSGVNLAHQLSNYNTGSRGATNAAGVNLGRSLVPFVAGLVYNDNFPDLDKFPDFPDPSWPGFAAAASARVNRDWDSGMANNIDGAFANKPEEGNTIGLPTDNPYFSSASYAQTGSGPTFFTPNRQVASPVAFGSLPTGIGEDAPWRTLLFRPQSGHPGASAPHDHLILDLFWMPVVEPYAISQPFSTAGKINMNFQIRPFTYIERSTGLWGLMKNERVAAIPNANSVTYKQRSVAPGEFRQRINIPATLEQWRAKFQSGEVFRSASEITTLHIVPETVTSAGEMESFWNTHALTGENLREGIYNRLYPRLTTQSNTYTVHYRVQSLKKVAGSNAAVWDESRDQVLGEQRGAVTIERYINPNDTTIPNFRDSPTATPSLATFYKWRLLNVRVFNP